ncbi:MAG: 2-phosphosulfolactate phosphatase [Actinomycetota bacterium]
MIKVDVLLSNQINKDTLNVKIGECICAVIDIIRATSTVTTMLAKGAERVLVADDKKQAYALKKGNKDFLLCGEEGGLAPRGFDYGNSPLELSGINMAKKTAILKTTNGTASLFAVKNAVGVYSLSLLNLSYTIDMICGKLHQKQANLLLVCSGEGGRIAYDDVFAAGLAIKKILGKGLKAEFSDSSKIALSTALSEPNIIDALEKSKSAQLLKGVGLGQDITFCANVDKYNIGGMLKIKESQLQIVPC